MSTHIIGNDPCVVPYSVEDDPIVSKNIKNSKGGNFVRIANKKAGFTLIELVVVITLLGILGSLAVASFGGVREAARDDAAYKKLDSIEDAFLYARTTNDFDNDKAISDVDSLVSVDGIYHIDASDDYYKITYTEDEKDYIVENGLYNYQKPEDNVEEKPVVPPVEENRPQDEFLGLANDLFLRTAEIADILAEFIPKGYIVDGVTMPYPPGAWAAPLRDYIEQAGIKDGMGITIENDYQLYALYEYISKFYYHASWPKVAPEIAEALGLEKNQNYYLRSIVNDGTMYPDPNTIVLYVSTNQTIPDTSQTNFIFLGKRVGVPGNYSVEGVWYQAPEKDGYEKNHFYITPNAPIGNRDTITVQMNQYGWQPVNFEKLDFKGGV